MNTFLKVKLILKRFHNTYFLNIANIAISYGVGMLPIPMVPFKQIEFTPYEI
ncbi:MAG: hypothetical protein V4654_00690 [Bdellovibrionota bacterium]